MQSIRSIKKRDGRIVDFETEKITEAIWNAAISVGGTDRTQAEKITLQVTTVLEVLFKDPANPPTVEQIQDLVEKILIEGGHAKTAKAYIIYRENRKLERKKQEDIFGKGRSTETLNFSAKTLKILQENFLIKDSQNQITETPEEMFRRVAHSLATPDALFQQDVHATEKKFFESIQNLELIPSSAILKNAGTSNGHLSTDFSISVDDNLDGIFSSLKKSALINANQGSVGVSFSKLRPNTDSVQGIVGVSSGPVSFIELFSTSSKILQKGAPTIPHQNTAIRIDHPNILEFIELSEKNASLTVILTPAFITAVKQNSEFTLINPRTNSPSRTVSARMLCDSLISHIWQHSVPKIIFQNTNQELIPTPNNFFLEPNETIHTASINLAKMLKNNDIDWDKLTETTATAVHFLDNAIEAHKYTLRETEEITKNNRKIEITPIGFSELLKELKLDINSDEATQLISKISSHIFTSAQEAAKQLNRNHEHQSLVGYHPEKIICELANTNPTPFQNTDILSQFTFYKTIQSDLETALVPTVSLGQDTTINDIEQAIFEAHTLNCQGIVISKDQAAAIETEIPKQISIHEREHSSTTGGAQEIIPPPMIEMSRIVKETLNKE